MITFDEVKHAIERGYNETNTTSHAINREMLDVMTANVMDAFSRALVREHDFRIGANRLQ